MVVAVLAAVVLSCLSAASAAGAAPRALEPRLDGRSHVPHVSLAASAAFALDLDTGEAVYSRNASLPLLPASNEKLAVTYAALTALGPSFTIETDVLGERSAGRHDLAGESRAEGLRRPDAVVRRPHGAGTPGARAGITRVTGRIVADESWFDARRTAPGWKAAFYIDESPPLSALIVDRGVVGRFTSHDPALAAGSSSARRSSAPASRVAGVTTHGVADDTAVPIAAVDSPPLAAIVRWMDRVSDNFEAEMLLKELGAVQADNGTTAAGVGVVAGLLAQAGVPMTGVRLVDGSGLSLLDRFTANALVSLLTVDVERPRRASRAARVAPGRRAQRDARRPDARNAAAGVVLAKTGTTSNASALSGFVGDRYVFSILQNGWPLSWSWARIAQDRFAAVLAASQ